MITKENIIVAIAALVEHLGNTTKEIKPNFYVLHPSTKIDAKVHSLHRDGVTVEWPNGLRDKTPYENFEIEDLKNILDYLLAV